jgi:hypothetical protein
LHLLNKPDAGKVIRGSGGLRKLGWPAKGHGKSGGTRIIYRWFVTQDTILTPEQVQQLKRVVEGEYP